MFFYNVQTAQLQFYYVKVKKNIFLRIKNMGFFTGNHQSTSKYFRKRLSLETMRKVNLYLQYRMLCIQNYYLNIGSKISQQDGRKTWIPW